MRGPSMDVRQQVRCFWEGALDNSPSVARLWGQEIVRNLALNPRAAGTHGWNSRGTLTADGEGGILTLMTNGSNNVANVGYQVMPADDALFFASYLVQNLGETPINMRIQAYTTSPVSYGENLTLPPDGQPRLLTYLGIPTGPKVSPRLYSGNPGPTGNLLRISKPVMAFTAHPFPYFDGSTTDMETLMALYSTIGTLPPA